MPITRTARWLAIVLLVMEGLPAIGVGLSLAPAIGAGGLFLVVGLVAYGVASLVGAAGMLLDRRWGWRVGLATVLIGLAILVVVLGLANGNDEVIAGGIVTWVATLVALLIGRPRRA